MSTQMEEVEVKYCDFCGKRESDTNSIGKCWKCGKDCCNNHLHLVAVSHGGRMLTYLCDQDRDELVGKLKALFRDFILNREWRESEVK